jgi:hypothetical protein
MGVSVQHSKQLLEDLNLCVLLFGCDFAINPTKRAASTFVEISEILVMIRQAFGEESMSRTRKVEMQNLPIPEKATYTEIPDSPREKKVRKGKRKIQENVITFL